MANMITIDGKEYDADKLPPEAIAHIAGLQFCELELRRLQMNIATVQTSQAAYAKALGDLLGHTAAATSAENAASNFQFASDTVKFN